MMWVTNNSCTHDSDLSALSARLWKVEKEVDGLKRYLKVWAMHVPAEPDRIDMKPEVCAQ